MNSQSQSSQNTPKVPSFSKTSSLKEGSRKKQSKKASSIDGRSPKFNEYNRKPKLFASRQEMQKSLGKSINYLNGSLYEDLWASAIASSMKLFQTNIKQGQQFQLNAEKINQILLSLKDDMEASLQDEEIQNKKQKLKYLNKENIILQLEKSGYQGQIDLTVEDPQQLDLHARICNYVKKIKDNGQEAWHIENFCEAGNFLQNERFLYVFQLKRNIQLQQSEIPKCLTQIIKIALAKQELYFEKLIQCKVLRQLYYRQLLRTKESADKILEKPRIMLYYITNNNITRDQFSQKFRKVKPMLRHLFSQLGVVMNVIGYNPISPNELKKQKQMKQLRKQIAQMREREAQMREREAKRTLQMQIMKEKLESLIKDKSS